MTRRIVSCVSKGGMSLPVDSRHNRPSEAHCFGFGGLQAALQASPSLAWSCPQYAISDVGFAALRQFEKFDKFDKFDKFVT